MKLVNSRYVSDFSPNPHYLPYPYAHGPARFRWLYQVKPASGIVNCQLSYLVIPMGVWRNSNGR